MKVDILFSFFKTCCSTPALPQRLTKNWPTTNSIISLLISIEGGIRSVVTAVKHHQVLPFSRYWMLILVTDAKYGSKQLLTVHSPPSGSVRLRLYTEVLWSKCSHQHANRLTTPILRCWGCMMFAMFSIQCVSMLTFSYKHKMLRSFGHKPWYWKYLSWSHDVALLEQNLTAIHSILTEPFHQLGW